MQSANEFFTVTERNEKMFRQFDIHIFERSIYSTNKAIRGKDENKIEVMMYKRKWIDYYYYHPLEDLHIIIEGKKEEMIKRGRLEEERIREEKYRSIREAEERKRREEEEKERIAEQLRQQQEIERNTQNNHNNSKVNTLCCLINEVHHIENEEAIKKILVTYFILTLILMIFFGLSIHTYTYVFKNFMIFLGI